MAKTGKRLKAAYTEFDKEKSYQVSEAISIAKRVAKVNFDETVDISIKLNLKKGQSVRDTMVLPHQTSSEKKILVFARGEKVDEAVKAGATYVGDMEYIEKIKGGWLDFDVVIATPDMMKEVGKLGPILGRRGMMPNPKAKTVTTDIVGTISELQKGRIEIRSDKTGVMHVAAGKISMSEEDLVENVNTVLKEVRVSKPSDTKGDFLVSVSVSSTMGPGIRIATGLV